MSVYQRARAYVYAYVSVIDKQTTNLAFLDSSYMELLLVIGKRLASR